MIQRITLILYASLLCCRWTGTLAQNTNNYADTLIEVGKLRLVNLFFKRYQKLHCIQQFNKLDSSGLKNWYNNYLDELLLTNYAIDDGILKEMILRSVP